MPFEPLNPHTTTIELAAFVLGAAFERATAIENEDRRLNRKDGQGFVYDREKSFQQTYSSYCAEAAVATVLGLDPIRKGDHFQNRPDVGGYDVFASKRPNAGLIFTPHNPLWSVKILVIDENPTFHVCGCYQCADARERKDWWREPRPGGGCWIVPQQALRPVNSGDDVRPIGERQKHDLEEFSRDWRKLLTAEGIKPPDASPLSRAIAKHTNTNPGR